MSKSCEPELPESVAREIDRARGVIDRKVAQDRGETAKVLMVSFLPRGLTREGSGMISAMGTRNPHRYGDIAKRTERLPAAFHQAVTIVPPEEIQRAGGKMGRIAHTSIMEQVKVGANAHGGDRAIAVEGISALSLLEVVARMRYGALEIFSSRAGVLTDYYLPPEVLKNRQLKDIYVRAADNAVSSYRTLSEIATAYFFATTSRQDDEKRFDYEQRVLSLALDQARYVTPLACKLHGTFTFANALAAQEEITRIWSYYPQYPEVNLFCQKVLRLLSKGTPTLLKYTSPKAGMINQQRYQWELTQQLGPAPEPPRSLTPPNLKDAGITYFNFDEGNIDRLGAAILARYSSRPFAELLEVVRQRGVTERDKVINKFLGFLNPYDLPPEELGVIKTEVEYTMDVGAVIDVIRHRPPKKIGAIVTRDLGVSENDFWKEAGGQQAADLYRRSFEACDQAWRLFMGMGLPIIANYLIQRANLMRLYMMETGSDQWRMDQLRTDEGTHVGLRTPMRAKHDYLVKHWPQVYNHFPVTYK